MRERGEEVLEQNGQGEGGLSSVVADSGKRFLFCCDSIDFKKNLKVQNFQVQRGTSASCVLIGFFGSVLRMV